VRQASRASQYILSSLFHTLPLLWKKTKCWSWQNSLLYSTRHAVHSRLSQYSSSWSTKKRLAENHLHFPLAWNAPGRKRRRFNSPLHVLNTGLFEMTVVVLTTCHTWDRSICIYIYIYICIFYVIKQHSKFLLHTLQVLYMCSLCDSTNINTIIKFVSICL
jgi:hypothetical protein